MTEQVTARGRVIKPVDTNLIYKLAMIHCSNKEIASILGICVDTLQRKYHDILDAGKDAGKGKLRRSMWDAAINGKNPTMMIWLSKQHLGMTDNPIATDDKKPLPWTDEELTNAVAQEQATPPDQAEEIIVMETYEDTAALTVELERTLRG